MSILLGTRNNYIDAVSDPWGQIFFVSEVTMAEFLSVLFDRFCAFRDELGDPS